jgi:LiaF transmembrane domain
MEPYQFNYRYRCQAGSADRFIPAIILIGIGVIFLVHNLHLLYFQDVLRYWPGILIAVGLVKLVDSASNEGRIAGGVLAAVGGIFMLQSLGYLTVGIFDLWPLFLIAVGVWLLVKRTISWPLMSDASANMKPGRISESAVFGGGKRNIVDPDFRGGKVDAVFGGFEIDLRRSAIVGDCAEMEVNAVFGGVEIRVPEHWRVEVRGTGVFGGYSDETRQPSPAEYPVIKRLIVKGGAVFGGVVVKN